MKKLLILLVSAILAFDLMGCAGGASESERPQITGAAAATFEFAADMDKGKKVITSEIASLYTFDSLILVPADDSRPVDWIYRIVFDPPEIVKGGKAITVLFGSEGVSINGKRYIPADKTNNSQLLRWAEGKYAFFDYTLQPPN